MFQTIISLTSFKLHLTTRIVTEETFPVKIHSNSLEVTLIVVSIKEALELHKYFVEAIAKFSVARMVCLGGDVALKVLDIIK